MKGIQINFLQINEITNQPCHPGPVERGEIIFIQYQLPVDTSRYYINISFPGTTKLRERSYYS